MAVFEERPGGEPTEPPSAARLRDARRRGEVARSQDVTAAAVFVGVALLLHWTWPALVGELRTALAAALRGAPTLEPGSPRAALDGALRTLVTASLPVLAGAFALALLGSFAQVGPLLTLQALKPTLRRLSPARNLAGVLGRGAAFELIKTLVKLAGIGCVALDALRDELPRVLGTLGAPPEALLEATLAAAAAIALRVGIVVAVLAAADLVYQRHAHRRRLRMTRVEVQREQRERDGDPQRKAERRRAHREILDHDLPQRLARADCVIVNPEHIAVALRYDASTKDAPTVVARGRRLVAARIRELARQHGVPIVRAAPLAHALVELDLDQQVPPELYEPVAEVLRLVHRLRQREVGAAGDRGPA